MVITAFFTPHAHRKKPTPMRPLNGRYSLRRSLAALCGVLFSTLIAFAAEPAAKNFDVPAGRAEATLPVFAQQAGIELVFSVDKVEGVQTHAVKGQFTVRTALDQMVAGTALVVVEDAKTGAFAIRRDDPAPKSSDAPVKLSQEDPNAVYKLEGFTVRGYRESLQASLDEKRKASNVVDVITAEDVGKFPDTNVAESLSHVPGVTVDRLFGQGERVSILGTDPNLNRTLLNGQTVASGDWFILDAPSRQFNYTLLAPEVIGQAEVHKTPEARLPEGSIGGTIILTTRDPLKLPELTFSGSIVGMYNDRDKNQDGGINEVASWHNKEGTLGVLLGLQDSREHIRRDGVEALGTTTAGAIYANQQAYNSGVSVPASSPGITSGAAVLPNAINTAYFLQVRQRTGGNLVVAFKPTDRLDIVFNGLDVKVNDNNFNSSFYAFPGWWKGGVIQSGQVANGILNSATITNNIGVMDIFYREAQVKTNSYDVKATYRGDNFTFSQQAGTTRASGGTQHQFYIEPLLSYPAGNQSDVGTTSYSYTGGGSNPGFSFTDTSVAANPKAWTVGGPWWNGNMASDPETDSEKYAQIDGEYKLALGPINKLLAGVKYSDHHTAQNWYNITLASLPFSTAADFGPTLTPGNYLDGLPNITSDMKSHVIINPHLLLNSVSSASYNSTMTMQQALDAGNGFQAAQSFAVAETVDAGYIQADFAAGHLNGNAGVRIVQTRTASDGYSISGSTVTPITMTKNYTNVLPSLNLAYEVAQDSIARFGASQVIARPNYADQSSSVTLYDSIRQGVGGNPHLDPYKSNDLDGAYEWYFAKNSVVAVNVFYKDIANYILKSNGTESYFNQNMGAVTPYTISRPQNAGKATSKGFAVAYQQTFPLGFGTTFNYTYVDASTASGGELPYASKNQINFSPFYESGKLLLRLTYGWRSDYFTNVDRGNNVYTKAYAELDANAAYNLTKNLSLTVAATNLLDETYATYAKIPAKMFQSEYKNGRRLQIGLHWNY